MFKNMNIRVKLLGGFSMIIIILIIVSAITYTNVQKFSEANAWNVHTYNVIEDLEKTLLSMVNMETGQRGFAITGDEQFLEPYNLGKEEFFILIDGLIKTTSDNPAQTELLTSAKQQAVDWIDLAEKSITKRRNVEKGIGTIQNIIADERQAKGKAAMDGFRATIAESLEMERQLLVVRSATAERLMQATNQALTVGTVLAILLALVASFLITNSIVKPIKRIIGELNIIASGNLTNDIPEDLLKNKAETGQLSHALQTMQQDLKHLLRNVASIADNVTESSHGVASISEKTSNSTREISKSIEQVAHAATDQVDETHVVSKRADALAALINDNNEAITEVFKISEFTSSLSENGQKIMKDLNIKTTENNEKTKEVNEVIIEVNQFANNAESIISIIENISTQTNLLALNASIEAARAGEAGRGFAVVADEIRQLAEDTLVATNNINELIQNIQVKSDNAVQTVNQVIDIVEAQNEAIEETVAIFNQTSDQIGALVEKIDDVKNSSTEMDTSKSEIVAAIIKISGLTEDTSASTQEISAATEEQLATTEELYDLAEETKSIAEELTTEVGKFKI